MRLSLLFLCASPSFLNQTIAGTRFLEQYILCLPPQLYLSPQSTESERTHSMMARMNIAILISALLLLPSTLAVPFSFDFFKQPRWGGFPVFNGTHFPHPTGTGTGTAPSYPFPTDYEWKGHDWKEKRWFKHHPTGFPLPTGSYPTGFPYPTAYPTAFPTGGWSFPYEKREEGQAEQVKRFEGPRRWVEHWGGPWGPYSHHHWSGPTPTGTATGYPFPTGTGYWKA